MLALGIDQWDENSNRTIIEQDLRGCYYMGIIMSEIVAGMRVDNIQDPTYLNINWADKQQLHGSSVRVKTKVWNKE